MQARGMEDGVDNFVRGEGIDGDGDVSGAVERKAVAVAGFQVRSICEDGADIFGAATAREGGGQFNLEMDEEGAGGIEQERARGRMLDGAAAEGEDQGVAGGEACDFVVFALAEGCLAVEGKELGDGYASFGFNHVVHIEKGPSEAGGKKRAYGGLARAHEACEHDAAGQGGGLGLKVQVVVPGPALPGICSIQYREAAGDG